jgi:chromosome segregation ATPase
MNRTLQYVNFFGVVTLASLCAVQWQNNRRLNLETIQLEKTRQAQLQKISEQEEAARGLSADLTDFKQRFKSEHDDLEDTKRKLREDEGVIWTLTAERNQLRESITNWTQAVAQRDALMKEANSRIEEVSTQLNASIRKYNELATNYNNVVKDLNEARLKSVATTNSP